MKEVTQLIAQVWAGVYTDGSAKQVGGCMHAVYGVFYGESLTAISRHMSL